MKTRTILILMAMIMTFGWSARADETITVSATNEDISQDLDLKAVAALFGQCANLATAKLIICVLWNRRTATNT